MIGATSDSRFPSEDAAANWTPSHATRFWLLVGVVGVALDLGFGLAIIVLEQANWGKDGLTPDVGLSFAAIVPQIGVVLAYLYLASDAGIRSLWKSMAGLFAAYLLMSGLALTMYEVLPPAGNIAIAIGAGIGMVALMVFSFGPWPRFASANISLAPASEEAVNEQASKPEPAKEESGAGSWWGHGIALLVIFLVRRLMRNANWLPNFGLDGWALLEMVVLAVIGMAFAIWFAATKIAHRHKLGTTAAVLGGVELLILLVHLAMVAALFWLMMGAAAANPQLDGDFEKLLDPWLRQASIASAACHVVWALLTPAFFLSLWLRPQADWRAEFLNPSAKPLP